MSWLIIALGVVLLIVAGAKPRVSKLSNFELQRRCETRDEAALINWRRQEFYLDIYNLKFLVERLLFASIVVLLIVNYEPIIALGLGLIIGLLYPAIASRGLIKALPQRIYNRYESKILDGVEAMQQILKLIRPSRPEPNEHLPASRDEIIHIVNQSAHLLPPQEKKLFAAAFEFKAKLVKDIMTPRSQMEAIGAHELLGPLVLNDLHKTGHSHFPVFDSDIDHIVGILSINNLLKLSKQESPMVSDVMDHQVFYIRDDQPLADVLSACIKKRRHLLVVINEFRETVGVITIEDAIEQLIGQKIVGQYEQHDDIRAVAARNPKKNNQASNSSDV